MNFVHIRPQPGGDERPPLSPMVRLERSVLWRFVFTLCQRQTDRIGFGIYCLPCIGWSGRRSYDGNAGITTIIAERDDDDEDKSEDKDD